MTTRFSIKTVLFFVLAATSLLVASFVIGSNGGDNDIDSIPDEGTTINTRNHAYISSGGELISLLGGVVNYEMLSRDLYVFAKIGYEKYSRSENVIIGFRVSEVFSENNTTSVEGRFGAAKNKITISVKSLNYGRITSSITDTVTELNIDASLPSNTKRNQFIGTLPKEEDDYSIDYLPTDNSFFVNAYTPTGLDQAKQILFSGLQIDSLDDDDIEVLGMGSGIFGGGL